MRDDSRIQLAVLATGQAIVSAERLLRLFNEPLWPDTVESAIGKARDHYEKHRLGPQPSLRADYLELAGLLTEIQWPEAISFGEADSDERVSRLRGALGAIRMDIDRILMLDGGVDRFAQPVQAEPDLAPIPVPKAGHENLLAGVLKRLQQVDSVVSQSVSSVGPGDMPVEHTNIVQQYLDIMSSSSAAIKETVKVGPTVDLGLIERSTVTMVNATKGLYVAAQAGGSALRALLDVARQIQWPVRRLARGVRAFVRRIARQEEKASERPANILPPMEEKNPVPAAAGDSLRQAREAQGMSLEDIAARTRIPIKHLSNIEINNYGSLPSITYALGFAKAYARAVGIDEIALARQLRSELNA